MTLSASPVVINPVNPIPGLVFAPLTLDQMQVVNLAAYDGVTDFMGPSGITVTFDPVNESVCIRITNAATLANFFTDAPGGGIDQILFAHSSNDASSFIGCAPITFESDPMAEVEVSVSYRICGCSDCDNDGTCDVDETDDYGPTTCGPDGIPDDCQVFPDCDFDGIPDHCDNPDDCPDCVERHRRMPGSLLLFPDFDNRTANMTLFSITNTNCDPVQGDIFVELIYIDGETCLEDNFTIRMTPCDTWTVITSAQNPNFERGYAYAFVRSVQTGQAITFNHLIGQEFQIGGIEVFDWSINAVSFKGRTGHRAPSDVDQDNVRDLDGIEYDEAPERLFVPRFLGQDDLAPPAPSFYASELVLVNLSGGTAFTTVVDLLIFNDNEQPFSAAREFYCWDREYLVNINGAFRESFLEGTNHDPDEIVGARREAGWFWFDGNSANSTQEFIINPAVYGFLIERAGRTTAADLPWEFCSQDNGDLLPVFLLGDPRPGFPGGVLGDNQ
jgi:hypothetical protein